MSDCGTPARLSISRNHKRASAVYAVVLCSTVCLSCPSICLSQVGFLLKRISIWSRKQRRNKCWIIENIANFARPPHNGMLQRCFVHDTSQLERRRYQVTWVVKTIDRMRTDRRTVEIPVTTAWSPLRIQWSHSKNWRCWDRCGSQIRFPVAHFTYMKTA